MAQLGTRLLKLEIDGTEYTSQVSNVQLNSAESDSDFITFADAAAGGARDYTLVMTIVQDTAAGSLWREIWDNTGDTVPFTIYPAGGMTPSAADPSFEGSAVIKEPDGNLLGGEANTSTSSKFTVEVEWPCTARPVLTPAA